MNAAKKAKQTITLEYDGNMEPCSQADADLIVEMDMQGHILKASGYIEALGEYVEITHLLRKYHTDIIDEDFPSALEERKELRESERTVD